MRANDPQGPARQPAARARSAHPALVAGGRRICRAATHLAHRPRLARPLRERRTVRAMGRFRAAGRRRLCCGVDRVARTFRAPERGTPRRRGQSATLILEAAIPRSPKLALRIPLRKAPLIGERAADVVQQRDVLEPTAQIRTRPEFVRGLVVVLQCEFRVAGLGPLGALLPILDAEFDVERRHAHLGEVEMIGAEEKAVLGRGFGHDDAILSTRRAQKVVLEFRGAVTHHRDVLGRPAPSDGIHVEGRHRAIERIHRVGDVVRRAEQTTLLEGDREEHDGSLGPLAHLAVGLGNGQQTRRARRVVESAVENGVTGAPESTAKVIPVRHVEHVLVGVFAAG